LLGACKRKVGQHLLQEIGCEIDVAEDGSKALQLFSEKKYHLLLMDIGLPDMDGFEVTQRIRQLGEAGRKSIIVALTAHASDEVREKCLVAGMNDTLTKPITKRSLQVLLSKWLLSEPVSK